MSMTRERRKRAAAHKQRMIKEYANLYLQGFTPEEESQQEEEGVAA
jgi:hypothetical protein